MAKIKIVGKGFTPIPTGTYDARVIGIIHLGLIRGPVFGNPEATREDYKVKLIFETPDFKRDDGTPYQIGKDIAVSNSKMGNLYKFVKAISGKNINEDDLKEMFDKETPLKDLLGKPVSIEVEQYDKKDGSGSTHKLVSVTKLDERIAKTLSEASSELIFFDSEKPDIETFKKLRPFTRATIIGAVDSDQLGKEIHKIHAELEEQAAQKKAPKGTNTNMGAIQ